MNKPKLFKRLMILAFTGCLCVMCGLIVSVNGQSITIIAKTGNRDVVQKSIIETYYSQTETVASYVDIFEQYYEQATERMLA